jgi:hypothetical protein
MVFLSTSSKPKTIFFSSMSFHLDSDPVECSDIFLTLSEPT